MSRVAWTWMVYIATHNNVAKFGDASVQRIRQAQLDERVRVLVQQETPQSCQRLVIGGSPEIVADMGTNTNSGDPQTLLEFIKWAVATAPAERYALVLWSHGNGWEPSEMARLAQQQPTSTPVHEGELKQRDDDERRHVFFASSVRRLLAAPTPAERAIAADDGSGHSLDCVELGRVLAEASSIIGKPLDLLGMNACQMASAEIAYQCREHARAYVASEEDMPAQSLPYDDILNRLIAQPDMDGPALAKLIVARYCAFYRDNRSLPWGQGKFPAGVTLAAIDPAGVASLAGAVKTLAAALHQSVDQDINTVWAAHRAALAFKFRLYDLASFCRALVAQPGVPAEVAEAAQGVLASLDDPAVILAREHTAPKYDQAGGLTTYLMPPTPGLTLSPYYAETDFDRDTRWGAFLAAYHAAAV